MALDSRITLRKLEVLCAVVELGGVRRAADQLYVTQPVISSHLRTLQDRLGGAPLLYRDGRRMRATEAGEAAYRWAKEVLGRTEEVVREIDGLAQGGLGQAVISAGMTAGSYMLPPILRDFYEEYPEARIAVQISDAERVLAQVETGAADFAILAAEAPIESRLFTVEQLALERFVLVASPDDDQIGERATNDELKDLRYVCAPRGLSRRVLIDVALRNVGIHQRNIVIELGHPEAVKRTVEAGMGVAFVSEASAAAELERGTLRRVEFEAVLLPIPLLLVQRSTKLLSPLQARLRETMIAAFAARSARA